MRSPDKLSPLGKVTGWAHSSPHPQSARAALAVNRGPVCRVQACWRPRLTVATGLPRSHRRAGEQLQPASAPQKRPQRAPRNPKPRVASPGRGVGRGASPADSQRPSVIRLQRQTLGVQTSHCCWVHSPVSRTSGESQGGLNPRPGRATLHPLGREGPCGRVHGLRPCSLPVACPGPADSLGYTARLRASSPCLPVLPLGRTALHGL